LDFVPMADLVGKAYKEGYAVPAFCAWNAEAINIILRVAARLEAPVILMSSTPDFTMLPPKTMASTARAILGYHKASAALHLDHGDSLDLVKQCVDANYTSVMLDFSTLPFDENVAGLKETVRLARPKGITVEGEIGHVGKANENAGEGSAMSAFTDVAEAVDYVAQTGVDLLAVSVGNKHGFYTGEPHMEFDLLTELYHKIKVPLVMHGGTGIPEKDIKVAVKLGISKVNIATDLVQTYRKALMGIWTESPQTWIPTAMGMAVQAIEPVVERWFHIVGAVGKAR